MMWTEMFWVPLMRRPHCWAWKKKAAVSSMWMRISPAFLEQRRKNNRIQQIRKGGPCGLEKHLRITGAALVFGILFYPVYPVFQDIPICKNDSVFINLLALKRSSAKPEISMMPLSRRMTMTVVIVCP